MTRTFVPGEATPALRSLHDACRSALEIAFEAIRPGPNDAYAKVAEHFESQGRPTLRTHSGSRPLQEGFSHELGHGVGLEVHEAPSIGRRGDDFVVGDVVAVEPALYFRGTGGVRLEDTVVVTDAGIEHFTDPLPYDLEP